MNTHNHHAPDRSWIHTVCVWPLSPNSPANKATRHHGPSFNTMRPVRSTSPFGVFSPYWTPSPSSSPSGCRLRRLIGCLARSVPFVKHLTRETMKPLGGCLQMVGVPPKRVSDADMWRHMVAAHARHVDRPAGLGADADPAGIRTRIASRGPPVGRGIWPGAGEMSDLTPRPGHKRPHLAGEQGEKLSSLDE